jgi:hypothetical protein
MVVLLCLGMALPVFAQGIPAPAAKPAAPSTADAALTNHAIQERLAKAVAELIKEANTLEDVTKGPMPKFKRPHPMLATWGPEMSLAALSRMTQPFTGNEYRDIYVRWHLLWVVQKVNDSQRRQMSQRLTQLVEHLPGALSVKKRPEVKHEPAAAYAAWHKAYYSLRIVKGYPPFQKYVNPPESLSELGPDATGWWTR